MMLIELVGKLKEDHQFVLFLIATLAVAVTSISITAIVASLLRGLRQLRVEADLKRVLIERGMSADEIVRVLRATEVETPESPCASQVVVEQEGDWHEAIVLKIRGEEYFVHLVGQDSSENEWVPKARLRFPARPDINHLVPGGVRANAYATKGDPVEELF